MIITLEQILFAVWRSIKRCVFVCSLFKVSIFGNKVQEFSMMIMFQGSLLFFSVFFLVFILESLSLSCVCSKTFNYSWVLFCCWKSRIRMRDREKNLVSEPFFCFHFSNETQIIIIKKKLLKENVPCLDKKIIMDHLEFQWKKNSELISESNVSRFNKV